MTDIPNMLSAAAAGALLRERREDRHMTQEQLAEAIGTDKSYISKLEGGVYNVGRSKYFPAVARALSLSDSDIRSINPAAVFSAPPLRPSDSRPDAQDGAVPLITDGLVEVPVYGMAAANPEGNVAYVRPVGLARIPPRLAGKDNMVTYLVLGDSMDDNTRDGIRDGDRIVCNHADTDLVENKIYVVKVPGNGILLKRVLSYADGELYLGSDNSKYRDLSPEDAQIIGRVVWIDPAGYVP